MIIYNKKITGMDKDYTFVYFNDFGKSFLTYHIGAFSIFLTSPFKRMPKGYKKTISHKVFYETKRKVNF